MADQMQASPNAEGHKNEKVGLVVSDKMNKTIVVEVTRRVPHALYKRIITKRKKFYAHDEDNKAKVGDTVRIVEHRPMSRLKRWALGDIVRKGVDVAAVEAGDTANAARRKKSAQKAG